MLSSSLATALSLAPRFSIHESISSARHVVNVTFAPGREFVVKEVIKGTDPIPKKWEIKEEEILHYLAYMDRKLGRRRPMEMVLFLREDSGGKWSYNPEEVVYFSNTRVWFNNEFRPTFTRATFLAELRKSLVLQEELRQIEAQRPSPERTVELIKFLLKHDTPAEPGVRARFFPGIIGSHLRMESMLSDPGLHSTDQVIRALESAKSESERTSLIDLIGAMSLGRFGAGPMTEPGFKAVAPFLERSNSDHVRRAAIHTLNRLDPVRAIDSYLPYLTLEDPEIISLLATFQRLPDTDEPLVVNNGRAASALSRLLDELEKKPKSGPHGASLNEAVFRSIAAYDHPGHIPMLMKRALNKDHPDTTSAKFALSRQSPRDPADHAGLLAWWKRNQRFLEPQYDLGSTQGLAAWMNAWDKADPEVRKILMKLWTFDAAINEERLTVAALKDDTAKHVLAKLWDDDRLTGPTRKAIVQTHVSFHLERVPTDKSAQGSLSLRIVGKSEFPFPYDAKVESRAAIAVDQIPNLPKRIGLPSLRDVATADFAKLTAPIDAASQAFGVIQLREIESRDGSSWEAEWKIEPLDLQ